MGMYLVELSNEVSNDIDAYCKRTGFTRKEAMRNAFALLAIMNREDANGNKLAVVNKETGILVANLINV